LDAIRSHHISGATTFLWWIPWAFLPSDDKNVVAPYFSTNLPSELGDAIGSTFNHP
jgi:hypothetical protein